MSKSGGKRTKRTVLLEHENQVTDFLSREEDDQKLIIALSPFVMYELEKRGISYKIPEDYYTYKELYHSGTSAKEIESLCHIIDRHIHETCPQLKELNIKPALFSFFEIKTLLDTVNIHLFQLTQLINSEHPELLIYYDGRRYPFPTPEVGYGFFFDPRESIYAQLLKCHGWRVQISTLPYVPPPEDSRTKGDSSFIKKFSLWFQKHPRLFDLASQTKKHGWRDLTNSIKKYFRAEGSEAILFGQTYEWDYCRKNLQSIGISPLFHKLREYPDVWMGNKDSDELKRNLRKAWEKLRENKKFRKFFVSKKIDFFPILESRFRYLVEKVPLACVNIYEKTEEIIRKRRVKIVLSSAFVFAVGFSAAQAARNHRIPVVTWQHGAYGHTDTPGRPYLDMMNSDFLLVYGEGVAKKMARYSKYFKTKVVTIGSASMESLYRSSPSLAVKKLINTEPRKKTIIYVLTTYFQNNLTVDYFPIPSDNHKWRDQKITLDVLAKYPDYTVVVKTKPCGTREPMVQAYAREKNYKNFRFIGDECGFVDLIPFGDIFVFQTPTTAFLQALTTTKPIFIHTQHHSLDPHAEKMLKRRAFCYRNAEEMAKALDKYLSNGKICKKVNLSDKEFLKAYVISSYGVGSGERVAKFLKSLKVV